MKSIKTPIPATPVPDRLAVTPILFSVEQVTAATNLSRSMLYNYMKSGMLRFLKAGSRRLIEATELAIFVARLRQDQEAECV